MEPKYKQIFTGEVKITGGTARSILYAKRFALRVKLMNIQMGKAMGFCDWKTDFAIDKMRRSIIAQIGHNTRKINKLYEAGL